MFNVYCLKVVNLWRLGCGLRTLNTLFQVTGTWFTRLACIYLSDALHLGQPLPFPSLCDVIYERSLCVTISGWSSCPGPQGHSRVWGGRQKRGYPKHLPSRGPHPDPRIQGTPGTRGWKADPSQTQGARVAVPVPCGIPWCLCACKHRGLWRNQGKAKGLEHWDSKVGQNLEPLKQGDIIHTQRFDDVTITQFHISHMRAINNLF